MKLTNLIWFLLELMEYEIYMFCNVLGSIIVLIIVLFHFVEADKKIKTKAINEDSKEKAEWRKF